MKTIKRTQMRLVEAGSPTELMVKFNQMMDELSGYRHQEPVVSLSDLTAYVIYTDEQVIAETREDRHYLAGDHYLCGDCKHYHENRNGAYADCPYRHGNTANYDEVCKEFWDAYEQGEDILYVPRNKDGSVNKTTKQGRNYLRLKEQGVVV